MQNLKSQLVRSTQRWICPFLIGSMCLGIAAADEPRRIQPAASLPETTPWDLASLSDAPEFSWGDGDEVRSLLYTGETYGGKPTRVFAYYATPDTIAGKPSTDNQFPAVVLVHGGGGQAFSQWARLWAERGFAAIAMDLAGNGPDKQRMPDGGPGQGHDMKFETIGLPVTEQWTYHAVANVIRAHSLIQSFSEVDSERTAVTGISWGGYLTCIVAGLDNRFQAAVPVYGCGFLDENSCWLGDFAKMSSEHQAKWTRLWDPSRYVGSAQMPMLFVNGGKDFAYPPDSHAKTYALVRSPKLLHFVPDLAHGHIFDRPKAIEQFINHRLNNGPSLPQISAATVNDGEVTATITTGNEIAKASLHFTNDKLSDDPRKRTWTSQLAKIDGKKISAAAAPASAKAWFLTATDANDVTVSTPLSFPAYNSPKPKGQFVPSTQKTPFQVLTAMGARLEASASQAKRAEYRRIFQTLDADRNKKLSRKEFVENGRYATPKIREMIFHASDRNHDGSLQEPEYITNRAVTDEAKQIMGRTDVNDDGSITRDEFLANSSIKSGTLAKATFAALDANNDGALLTPEYLRVWGNWATAPKAPPTPYENVKYGPFERNLLDVWLPKSKEPTPLIVFIHGGGFTGGSKDNAWRSPNVQMALDRGVAFATIQYRYRFADDDVDMKDPQRTGIQHVLRDSARAVQYLRAHAADYNLDKTRIACYGGSAGAGTSLWLATHDDLADPNSADPILRESSRISAAGMLAGQFTYDLSRWDIEFESRGGNILKTHGRGRRRSEFWRFYGLTEEQYNGPVGRKWRADVDMHALITPDDPPIFAMTGGPDQPPKNANIYNHHPYHAQLIEHACQKNGVEVLCLVPQVRNDDAEKLKENPNIMMEFFFKHLK